MNASPLHADELKKLNEMIKGIHIAMLTTVTPDGSLRSRPMVAQQTDFDGELWFFSEAESTKVAEIEANPHVNVAFADPHADRYVSAMGTATVVCDPHRARALWTPLHQTWFAGGPTNPNIALLKVHVHRAEYWDLPTGRMIQFYHREKASPRYQPGEHEKVDLDKTNPDPQTPPSRIEREA